MERIVRGFLVDVWKGEAKVVVFEDKLENIYAMLNVELIDVTERKVGNQIFDVVCDDEGLLKPNIPSAYDSKGEPALVGSLLFVNHDDEGNFSDLTEEQIITLKSKVKGAVIAENMSVRFLQVMTGVDYAI
jgi:hypothetical protein